MELYGSVTQASLEDPANTLRYARAAEVVLRKRAAADADDFNARIGLMGVAGRSAWALFQAKQDGAVEKARNAEAQWKECAPTAA